MSRCALAPGLRGIGAVQRARVVVPNAARGALDSRLRVSRDDVIVGGRAAPGFSCVLRDSRRAARRARAACVRISVRRQASARPCAGWRRRRVPRSPPACPTA
ncbi:hypothetical protein A8H31_10610 [Burkholderia thailandensis]|nr:hypothetical protein A8H31_10610 [Burkholderia thailandensis]NOK40355.1 hypothetical protein [Burkholderia thailandensis]NOK51957.1 hypothetical protein [Burkholderia thailandensis]PNE72649.1 hypothetical protein A8H38_11750 [Burkholderia thailandensis]PNE84635.1 hypothetical protein A8H34_11420 [Burkholderia thailandensis]